MILAWRFMYQWFLAHRYEHVYGRIDVVFPLFPKRDSVLLSYSSFLLGILRDVKSAYYALYAANGEAETKEDVM